MSADHLRLERWNSRVEHMLPSDSAEFLTPRIAEYFELPISSLSVTPVCAYGDGSGAVLSFSAPAVSGSAQQAQGRADHIFVSVIAAGMGARDHSFDSVHEEYDHPGVRIVPLDVSDWTYAYSVVVDTDARFIGGSVTRFAKLDGGTTLSVAFSGINGPLDHAAAHDVAHDILCAVGWADAARSNRMSV